jgi:hypothetical protein
MVFVALLSGCQEFTCKIGLGLPQGPHIPSGTIFVIFVAAVLGLSAIFLTSVSAFSIVKLLVAGSLTYLRL